MTSKKGTLIIGATAQGMQAALTLGRLGRKVTLIDRNIDIASPPKGWSDKGKRWTHYLRTQISYHPLLELSTETEASNIRQNKEDVEVELTQGPRWVLPDLCVDCQKCLSSCPVDLSNGRKPIFELKTPTTIAIDKREKAPCRLACPIGMNPQGYVALIGQGRFDEAYELILDKNPLPGICGRVCHHPCEKECRRQEIDEPVAICALKRFATDEARKNREQRERAGFAIPNGPRVAVIGSGPAGLTAANDLAKAGFRTTILESEDKPGGLLWHGIAPYRLPREIVEEEIEQILALGVDLRLHSPVNAWEDIESLKAEGFRAILLSTGASKDLRMNIRGEALDNIYGCVSFLKGIWKGKIPEWMGKVAVVGGGNAAVEAARASIRSGARSVTIVYRRTRKEMPADPHEVQQALEEGVKLRCLTAPVEFEGKNSALARIKCIKMQLKGVDASGRPRPIPVEGSEFHISADTAIISIGQEPDTSYGMDGDLRLSRRGTIEVGTNGETNIAGIYASGDVASGPSTVVEAMASGRKAAQAIIHALTPLRDNIPDEGPEVAGKPYDPVPKGMPKQKRRPIPHRETFERIKDNDEVIGPFSVKEAMKEASRCLQCGVCSECLRCETMCDLGAIRHERLATRRSFQFDQIIVSDETQLSPELDSSRVIRIENYGKTASWTRATIAGRAAAMQALSKTHPAKVKPISRRTLVDGDLNIGIFLCSCNETLNDNDMLDKMIAPLKRIQGVAHVEVLISACHPDKGRRIEEVIHEKGLNGALIASCVCCNLDFACESCTDQRMRLKNRLFIEGGYDPKDIAFVNIKETCLIPFIDDQKIGIEHAMRIIRSGLWQLKEQKTRPFISEQTDGQALILGLTEAGIAAAKGLQGQFPSVVMVENRDVDTKIQEELQKCGIDLLWPAKPIRLDGQRGNFTLILEKGEPLLSREEKKCLSIHVPTKGKRLRDLDSKIFKGNPRYQTIQADMIMLGRSEFKHIPHRRDDFERDAHACSRKAFGTLETAIPGVYMASWPQARSIPSQDLGKSAASEALERTFGKTEPCGYLVAYVDAEFCRGCGRCADICPEGAARLEETTRGVASSRVEPGLCTGCGSCIAECPTGAIRIPEYGQEYFEKVMNAFLG
jgi:NADPH-dependent glutamate synthase beta subunit-like oxidoreductase/NAD-dependent dihydropyrimidine dehydrogenase PreA subunit